MEEELGSDPGIVFFHVQTVFEGFEANTPARGVKAARDLGIKVAILYDSRIDGMEIPEVLRTYGTGGTPWTVVVDREGKVAVCEVTPDAETLRERVYRVLGRKPPQKK